MHKRGLFGLVLFFVCASLMGGETDAFRVLVFTKTAGFRHASIPDAIDTIRALGAESGFEVEATEDAAAFNVENLSRHRVVIFANTTGDVLNATEQEVFREFIRSGGGFVGIHSAADTEYDWPFYGGLVGAYFESHPRIQPATLIVEDATDASTAHLPASWRRTDEWYNFQTNPRGRVNVLISIDEATYEGGTMGEDHPMAWHHIYEGGRAWYTQGGHTSETYEEPLFRDHLRGGILWAAGLAPATATRAWMLYD